MKTWKQKQSQERIFDRYGYELFVDEKVHNRFGFDLIIQYDDDYGLYGKLVCEPGDSCENIQYALVGEDLEKIMPKKSYTIGKIRTTKHSNGFIKGLVPKRKLDLRECKHILRDLLGIDVLTRDDFDFPGEYKEYNDELVDNVNRWLMGELDDYVIMNYAYDCSDEPLGLINMITILDYLKKKKII